MHTHARTRTHAHTHTHTHTYTHTLQVTTLSVLLPVRKVAFGNNFKKVFKLIVVCVYMPGPSVLGPWVPPLVPL